MPHWLLIAWLAMNAALIAGCLIVATTAIEEDAQEVSTSENQEMPS